MNAHEEKSTCTSSCPAGKGSEENADAGTAETAGSPAGGGEEKKVARKKGRKVPDFNGGEVFGRLTVISFSHKVLRHRYWKCRCICGKEITTRGSRLASGRTLSCGCLCRESIAAALTTHGDSARGRTKEYKTWSSMIERCENPGAAHFADYGGRGIRVCERWRESYEDMGRKPSLEHSIDRIDTNGNYEPENCKWSSKKEQQRNKRNNIVVTHDGQSATLAEWAERTGLAWDTLNYRLKAGWPIAKALTKPSNRKRETV